jgi:hypothetical protein
VPDTILSSPPEWRESDPTRWYLVFCDAERLCWWDILFRTRAGFSHVYALRWDGFNWLLFNPDAAFTEVAIMPGRSENALQSLARPGATIVEVEAFRKAGRIRGRWWIGPMTCVEQLKALLGLPAGRVWTPWQLYRYLMEGHADERAIQKTQGTSANSAGKGTRAAPAFRARRIDPRGKRAPESHQARPTRKADVTGFRV